MGERERRGRSKGEEADTIFLQHSPSNNFSIDSQPLHTVKLFVFNYYRVEVKKRSDLSGTEDEREWV